MDFLLSTLQALPTGIGSFLLLLGLLIFVHELGHFWAAKYYGVRVETFSLGFGKKIFKYKHGDTTYCISLIPLGGYVKMFGDDPNNEPPPEERKFSFLHQPVWPRIVIVLGGPLMNLFFALFLFFVIGLTGETAQSPLVGDISNSSAAYKAGFRSGDTILEINGRPIRQWKDVKKTIEASSGEALEFKVLRWNGEAETLTATPERIKNPFIFSAQSEVGAIDGLDIEARASLVAISDLSSPAAQLGFRTLDQIESINEQPVYYWRDLERKLVQFSRNRSSSPDDQNLTFKVRSFLYSDDTREAPVREVQFKLSQLPENLTMESFGFRDPQTTLLSVKKGAPGLTLKAIAIDSPAAKAGLKTGDEILQVDNQKISKWDDVVSAVKSFDEKNKYLTMTFQREGAIKTVQLTPELTELPTAQGGIDKRYAIGIVPALFMAPSPPIQIRYGFVESFSYSLRSTWDFTVLIAMSVVRLVQAEVSPRNIGGVITIGRVASQSFQAGIDIFIKTMAIISINLFLLNLLPIPVLDGGHLLFFCIEAIKGSPISLKKMEYAQQFGMILLLCLMVFALFNDITHWISSR